METVMTSLETAITGIGSNMTSVIAMVTPIALGIVGTVMVIRFGVKLFSSLSKNR